MNYEEESPFVEENLMLNDTYLKSKLELFKSWYQIDEWALMMMVMNKEWLLNQRKTRLLHKPANKKINKCVVKLK